MGIGSFIQYMVPSSDYLLSNESKIYILYPLRVYGADRPRRRAERICTLDILGSLQKVGQSAPWMMNGRLPSGQDDSSLNTARYEHSYNTTVNYCTV